MRLNFAMIDRDWPQAKELIDKMKGGEDENGFAYGQVNVPVGCYSIASRNQQSGDNVHRKEAIWRAFAEWTPIRTTIPAIRTKKGGPPKSYGLLLR